MCHFVCGRDGDLAFCDEEPPPEVLEAFKSRRDGQIMGLELLSIAYGEGLLRCFLDPCEHDA